MAKTLYDKLWDSHVVKTSDNGTALIYIDRCLIHEVSSPQAFAGIQLHGRTLWRPETIYAVPDHQVPTHDRSSVNSIDPSARIQLQALEDNCRAWPVNYIALNDPRQGIVHVIGPELGITLPGSTLVCGDSHTATHGALACLALGIGTSDLEHVFATQCLVQKKLRTMQIRIDGKLPSGVTAKDLILHIIRTIGSAAGTGYAIEYCGEAVSAMSIDQRLTLCNMAIEAGAQSGLVAFDATTADYLRGKPGVPTGPMWERALAEWQQLHSDPEAVFDSHFQFDASELAPMVTWGTRPDQAVAIDGCVPLPAEVGTAALSRDWEQAMHYMGLSPGTPITEITVDRVFIGSCTNSRLDDLREAAAVVRGRYRADNVRQALVVPGSGEVMRAAEAEGLDRIFIDAGFEWRLPGCSMCNAMNDDRLEPGERCASTSNRNFQGRQGYMSRSHLVSPAMAAAAAVFGRFVDVRSLDGTH